MKKHIPGSLFEKHRAKMAKRHKEHGAEALSGLSKFVAEEKKEKRHKKNWIQSIGMKKGALHRQLGVPAGKKIPGKKLATAAKKGGKIGKRARLAETLKSFHRKGKKHRKSEEAGESKAHERGESKPFEAKEKTHKKAACKKHKKMGCSVCGK